MQEPSVPPLDDVLQALALLAERVAANPDPCRDPFVSSSLRRAVDSLELFIPGLDEPPNRDAAKLLERSAAAALERGDPREALARALRAMLFAPHHPGLFFVAASACFELGAVEEAVRLLRHTLWIQPGHPGARHDLEALTAWLDGSGENRENRERPTAQGKMKSPSRRRRARTARPTFDRIEDAPPPRKARPRPEPDADAGPEERAA